MKPSTLLALVLVACGLVIGCQSVERTVYDQQVSPETNSVTGQVTLVTNLTVKPAVQTGVEIIGTVPTPYTALGATAISLALAGYAAWRNSRSKKAAKAVTAGVQTYKETLPDKERAKLVKVLVDAQDAAGIRPEVNSIRGK